MEKLGSAVYAQRKQIGNEDANGMLNLIEHASLVFGSYCVACEPE